MAKKQRRLEERIEKMLEEMPGRPIIELAGTLGVNTTFRTGYLRALEDHGRVSSSKIGIAKVYFNEKEDNKDKKE